MNNILKKQGVNHLLYTFTRFGLEYSNFQIFEKKLSSQILKIKQHLLVCTNWNSDPQQNMKMTIQ